MSQPTIHQALDKMEDTRTVNAPMMVVALRKAVRDLEWYAEGHSAGTRQIDDGGLAMQSLNVIAQMLGAQPCPMCAGRSQRDKDHCSLCSATGLVME